MSRWRCCNSAGCILASGTGSDWSGSVPATWQPPGDFNGRSYDSWYLYLDCGDTIPEATLALEVADPITPFPFSIRTQYASGFLFIKLNDLTIGQAKPPPSGSRILLGIQRTRVEFSDPPAYRQEIVAAVWDGDGRLTFLRVIRLAGDTDIPLRFVSATARISPTQIAFSALGRLYAPDAPCCALFRGDCAVGTADTVPFGLLYSMTNFDKTFSPYAVDISTTSLDASEIFIEWCNESCNDGDGYYALRVLPAPGKSQLLWQDCGHNFTQTVVGEGRFVPPSQNGDRYDFHVCLMVADLGPAKGAGLLTQVGGPPAVIPLSDLFEYHTNCLKTASYRINHFGDSQQDVPALTHIKRATTAEINHHFPGGLALTNQRFGCPCLLQDPYPPEPIPCHGHESELPPDAVGGLLSIERLPLLSRGSLFFPLSFADGRDLPPRGVRSSDTCFPPGAVDGQLWDAGHFANCWTNRNEATAWGFASIVSVCRIGLGTFCWGFSPPPPPQYWFPLVLANYRFDEGSGTYTADYFLEWAVWRADQFILAGDTEVRTAAETALTFLILRMRATSKDYAKGLDFYLITPEPVPFPLLRGSTSGPRVPERSVTWTGRAFAGCAEMANAEDTAYVRSALMATATLRYTITELRTES